MRVIIPLALCSAALVLANEEPCSSYLRDFHCQSTCSRMTLPNGRQAMKGSLSCVCVSDPNSQIPGGRRCNMVFPQAFGPGIPSFAPLSDGDSLDEFRLNGLPEVRRVQAGAFHPVSRGLRVLRLTNNEIMYLERDAFANMTSLTLLDLSGNFLGAVDGGVILPSGDDTPNVEIIDFSNNHLETLRLADFSCFSRLRRLDLRDNRLRNMVQDSVYTVPPSLRVLTLSDNAILTHLTGCDFYVLCKALNLTLSIRGVTWRCDCNVWWLTKLYDHCQAVEPPLGEVLCYDDDYDYGYKSRKNKRSISRFELRVTEHDTSGCVLPNMTQLQQQCPIVAPACSLTDSQTTVVRGPWGAVSSDARPETTTIMHHSITVPSGGTPSAAIAASSLATAAVPWSVGEDARQRTSLTNLVTAVGAVGNVIVNATDSPTHVVSSIATTARSLYAGSTKAHPETFSFSSSGTENSQPPSQQGASTRHSSSSPASGAPLAPRSSTRPYEQTEARSVEQASSRMIITPSQAILRPSAGEDRGELSHPSTGPPRLTSTRAPVATTVPPVSTSAGPMAAPRNRAVASSSLRQLEIIYGLPALSLIVITFNRPLVAPLAAIV